jgi:HTH-type transcriptional regulator / antitoxin HipB
LYLPKTANKLYSELTCFTAMETTLDYPIQTLSQLRPILQSFRKKAGLTQAAVASKLGITQQSYAQIEANPASTSVERLYKILRLLNVDLVLMQTQAERGTSVLAPSSAQKESW